MKLEFDSIDEMKKFLEEIGYVVVKYGTTIDLSKNPYSPSPFTYPNPPITYVNYDKAMQDPNLSEKIMCKTTGVEIPTKTEKVL